MNRIAIFASGSGSNAENIIQYFKSDPSIEICLIVTNSWKAGVLERANRLKVPAITITRNLFYESEDLINILNSLKIDLVVLAGFLWLVPESLIDAFPNKIINIHPALLPKYGGKGMYGHHIHIAVKANLETESGITIHYVNKDYDEGQIIRQERCVLERSDDEQAIAQKIHSLEFKYFPLTIKELLD